MNWSQKISWTKATLSNSLTDGNNLEMAHLKCLVDKYIYTRCFASISREILQFKHQAISQYLPVQF